MKNSDLIISADLQEDAASEEPGGDAAEQRLLAVPPSLHGQRLDRALALLAPEFSRSYLQQLIEAGAVMVAGEPASRASAKVKAGQGLTVELQPTAQSQAFTPEALALDVVFEDKHLLVVNKPAGLVVHPAPGNWKIGRAHV